MSAPLQQCSRPPPNCLSRLNNIPQRSRQYLYSSVAGWLSDCSLIFSRYCLLIHDSDYLAIISVCDRWQQRSWSGDNLTLWSMTTCWQFLSVIDEIKEYGLVIISTFDRWWQRCWSGDVISCDRCRDNDIDKPARWPLLTCIISRMKAVEK